MKKTLNYSQVLRMTISSFILLMFMGVFLVLVNSCATDENGEVVPLPFPPSDLSAQLISGTQVDLTWTDNATNESGYKIERKQGSGQYSNIGSVNTDVTKYSDIGLTLGETYTYRVYSFNKSGNSATYSNEVTIKMESTAILTTTNVTSISKISAISGGNIITADGGAPVTARGVCWSTNQNPTIANSKTTNGTGTGSFTSSLSGLLPGTTYFVRAYATNSVGTSYGNELCFTTTTEDGGSGTYPPGSVFCNCTPTAVVDVTNPTTGKIWMDRNLGASQVATSSTDANSYGDLYQWGRRADGHQCRNSATTSTLSSTDQPSHGDFILTTSSPYDWRSPQNSNLWQGVNGVNNPCPSGYRLPTDTELQAERLSWSTDNAAGAFASPLKLPAPGYSDGSIGLVGVVGYYWSSTVYNADSFGLYFGGSASMSAGDRALGGSVRCIKD